MPVRNHPPSRMVVGLISDTHGLVRPDVHTALAGVSLILHAGDVGEREIIDELELIAPVQAVRGNTDPLGVSWLPATIDLTLGGVTIHVEHGHRLGSPTPAKLLAASAADVVIYGHTHRQLVTEVHGRLVVNPGAAGARRFDLLPSVARLTLEDARASVELVPLSA